MLRRLLIVTLLLFVACQPDGVQTPESNSPPSAVIVPVYPREEGALVSLDGTRSSDPDDDSLSYAWSFGDGGGAPGATPAHAYHDDGSYTVMLVVKDRAGAADTATTQVVISNAPPVITSLLAPAEQRIDSAAKISVAVTDPGFADTYDLIVDWGDGALDTLPGAKEATHKYGRPGSFQVQVTARDDDGAESRIAASPIDVFDPTVNRQPVATISGPSETREGAIVQFSAVGSMDPDGDSLTFIWLLGDGNTWSDNGVRMGWTYKDNGTFTASVIVRDQRGGADTATAVVVVQNTPPVILHFDPPSYQTAGVTVSTQVTISDSGVADTHVLTVDWGDRHRDSVTVASDPYQRFERYLPPNTVVHAYAAPGVYSVRATVRDKDGAVDSLPAGHVILVIDPNQRRQIAGYEALDLGTLGGNSAEPRDFNDYGQIVGWSLTSDGATHAFVWKSGAMTDLGTLGRENSVAYRINNEGLIAGSVWTGTNEGNTAFRPTTWRDGAGTVLGDTPGPNSLVPNAMNESGDIVWTAFGHERPYAWAWESGRWHEMGGLLGQEAHSWADAMNERGQIVGSSEAVYTGQAPSPYAHAFLWENGAMRDLGFLAPRPCRSYPDRNCAFSEATDINESGQIVGFSSDSAGDVHAVLWENGTVRALWKAPSSSSTYYPLNVVINDVGQVAGSRNGEGFFWSGGRVTDLGSLGGEGTVVVGINEAGTVVGTSRTANREQHAFVWREASGMVDLGTGPHGLSGAWVVGISYFGDIVGFTGSCRSTLYSCDPSLEVRAVMWRNTTGTR